MTSSLSQLLLELDLEPTGSDRFAGKNSEDQRPRIYGGAVAAQALIAAARTLEQADALSPHSVHCYFLRAGTPGQSIDYQVERLRDGRSFSTRRVAASQKGECIFEMLTSFHRREPGPEHQQTPPAAPPPEQCKTWPELLAEQGERWPEVLKRFAQRSRPVELRPIRLSREEQEATGGPRQRVWVRADGELPADPLLHYAVALYATDHWLLSAITRPHGRGIGFGDDRIMAASLDHAVWFHREVRADRWLLCDQYSPVAACARGLGLAHFYDQAGKLCLTVAQEGLVRPVVPRG